MNDKRWIEGGGSGVGGGGRGGSGGGGGGGCGGDSSSCSTVEARGGEGSRKALPAAGRASTATGAGKLSTERNDCSVIRTASRKVS